MQQGTILSLGALALVCAVLLWQKHENAKALETISASDPQTIRDPQLTVAPDTDAFYDEYKGLIPDDILKAIRDINQEVLMRDQCNERHVVQPDLETLKQGKGFSRQLTHEESTKIAGMAADSLNEVLTVPRLTLMDVQQGLKVHPSGHILVPFIIHDVVTLSSIKLVVTLVELVPDCDRDPPKHAIQQILPYNQLQFSAVIEETLPKESFARVN
jgi:hypothetical protein